MEPKFPAGVVVFFRQMASADQLARAIIPRGREVKIGNGEDMEFDDYTVTDAEGNFLALFPRDFVAAIMPLSTEGPASANYKPTSPPN